MKDKGLSFRQVLDSVTRLLPRLRNPDGTINLSQVAEYCKAKGRAVSQPTLYRHYHSSPEDARELSRGVIDALSEVFRLPRELLEGEVTANMEKALTKASLETLLLAEKIQRLPPQARANLLNQVEDILTREEELHRAISDSNVIPLDRERR